MKKLFLAAFLLTFPVFIYAAEFSGVKLTKEQCDDWKSVESITLTDENKKLVEDSCKERYSSENALDNCTTYEGEDLITYLKNEAKKQCK